MFAVIHVGNTASDFEGWADIGWNTEGGAGVAGLVRLANTQRVQAAQNLLCALLYGGVFARHPTLTVLLAEMRVGWVPPFVSTLDAQSRSSAVLGDWPWDVRVPTCCGATCGSHRSPGFGDTDALEVLAALPEMCVFSSDYPHQEGNARADRALPAGASTSSTIRLRSWFLGGNVEACFVRMGDPLPGDLTDHPTPVPRPSLPGPSPEEHRCLTVPRSTRSTPHCAPRPSTT